jgi:hypothetical protein
LGPIKTVFFNFEKRSSLGTIYRAGVVVINFNIFGQKSKIQKISSKFEPVVYKGDYSYKSLKDWINRHTSIFLSEEESTGKASPTDLGPILRNSISAENFSDYFSSPNFIHIYPGVDVMITIFCDFRQFSAKKLAFFSKTNVMIKIVHNLALF